MTQKELAIAVGKKSGTASLEPATASRWENDRQHPERHVHALSQVLGIPVDQLIRQSETRLSPVPVTTEQIREWLAAATPEERERVLGKPDAGPTQRTNEQRKKRGA